jgi:YcaO-like protein with predicted kinase domain
MTTGSRTDEMPASRDQDPVLSARARTLTEVEELCRKLLPEVGITRVADVTDMDILGIPIFQAVRPTAAEGLNTVTNGKGMSRQGSRVSAMMEGLERFCSELRERVPRTASYSALSATENALDPRRLILRAESSWTSDAVIWWWPMTAVSHGGAAVWVPAAAVFKPYTDHHQLLRPHTIGLAAGNTWEEAVLHGLLEVLEHDAIAHGELLGLGWRVRDESLPLSARDLLDRFRDAHIAVHVQAYPSALGVPVPFVIIEDTMAGDPMLFNGGSGLHLDLEIGLLRALTEAAQARLAVIVGGREDLENQAYRRVGSYADARERMLAWTGQREWIDFDELPRTARMPSETPLATALRLLRDGDLPLVLATELAPDDWPFSVAKVVIPGAEVAHVHRTRIGSRLRRRGWPSRERS